MDSTCRICSLSQWNYSRNEISSLEISSSSWPSPIETYDFTSTVWGHTLSYRIRAGHPSRSQYWSHPHRLLWRPSWTIRALQDQTLFWRQAFRAIHLSCLRVFERQVPPPQLVIGTPLLLRLPFSWLLPFPPISISSSVPPTIHALFLKPSYLDSEEATFFRLLLRSPLLQEVFSLQ